MSVDYRTTDADEGGEGWPRARTDHFTLAADEGPWRVQFSEDDVDDVAMWAATADPVADVAVALAADVTDEARFPRSAAALAYFDAGAARALAAQLLTAATAAEAGGRFDPNHDTADEVYR